LRRHAAHELPLLFRLQIQAFAELHDFVAINWHSACDGAVAELQPPARRFK
jgi:hypothetical protein